MQRYNIAAFWNIVPGPLVSPHFNYYLDIDVQRPSLSHELMKKKKSISVAGIEPLTSSWQLGV
jgi:hypothetical protein